MNRALYVRIGPHTMYLGFALFELKDGQPKSEFTGGVGVSSIVRAAEKYDGDYDFKNDKGVFVFRLIMNMEPASERFGRGTG